MLLPSKEPGLTFQTPLPACHSQQKTPTSLSLRLKFWDVSLAQNRILELQCPYRPPPLISNINARGPSPASLHAPGPPSPPSPPSPMPEPPPSPPSPPMPDASPSPPLPPPMPKVLPPSPPPMPEVLSPPPPPMPEVLPPLMPEVLPSPPPMPEVLSPPPPPPMPEVLPPPMPEVLPPPPPPPMLEVLPPPPMSEALPPPSPPPMPEVLSSPPMPEVPLLDPLIQPLPLLSRECTLDRNFVFTVPASLTNPPLSPALLVAPGNVSCKPRRVTPDFALFQIPMDGCGTHKMVLGETVIYILEVVNNVESITLDYGTITRDSPVRIFVECRFPPGSPVATTSYMTKIPSLGSAVQGQGVFGVQLRIAKDARYTSYHTQYHVPLHMLLGEPLYLELRLVNPPDPQLVLLVHYCVAYPRSAEAMWVILYKACPNPYDPGANNVILPSLESQTRRFTISTFQFLQKGKTSEFVCVCVCVCGPSCPLSQVYFMCSTEACVSQDGLCVEGCLDQ
ncbi:hypothetical protein NHX12_018677 [Muraenolepis orangiensis]|uniref:ZP domain-containing protein n=1 Tax=Muraenolepis orangiensis TaxID=630683 RepID=A0A9Q0EXR5_9TELE|nr:hypothetical protein NHX12_018677 [Muraenolepis orangiensis]